MGVWEGVAMDSIVSLGLAMPDSSTPCGQATPETTLRLSSTLLDIQRRTPMSGPTHELTCLRQVRASIT
jgi:hypothetical protein